jgi:hypothetical protein
MIIRCKWCEKESEEKEPFEDKSFTDSVCEECKNRIVAGDDSDVPPQTRRFRELRGPKK